MLSSTLGRRKVGETFPKSAGCTLEEQKRPKVLPKAFEASLNCIVPKHIMTTTLILEELCLTTYTHGKSSYKKVIIYELTTKSCKSLIINLFLQ